MAQNQSSIAVTGALGFVGRTLCPALVQAGYEVLPLTRQELGDLGNPTGRSRRLVPDLFEGVDQGVHLAAIAHRQGVDDARYAGVNHHAVLELAHAAASAGCRRFIFLSTAKVLGDTSPPGQPFHDDWKPAPPDAYARAKLAAELDLAELAVKTGIETISLRPPLVHGANASANFERLLQLCRNGGIYGLPVPLGAIGNQRSLISVEALAAAIIAVANSGQAVSGQYLVAEQPALSTSEIIRAIADGMGKRAPLINLPETLLGFALKAIGKTSLADRLTGDFAIDDSRFRTQFNWQNDQTSYDSIAATARDHAAATVK
jgi:nucleoside-diphosphate-sugar epimerase